MPATRIRSAENVTRPESKPESELEPGPEPPQLEPVAELEPAPVERRGWLASVGERPPLYYLGLAAVAGAGLVEWPVAVTIGVTYFLVRRNRIGT